MPDRDIKELRDIVFIVSYYSDERQQLVLWHIQRRVSKAGARFIYIRDPFICKCFAIRCFDAFWFSRLESDASDN